MHNWLLKYKTSPSFNETHLEAYLPEKENHDPMMQSNKAQRNLSLDCSTTTITLHHLISYKFPIAVISERNIRLVS